MNLKTTFGIGLVSLGIAFAQEGSYESTPMAQSMSEQELQKQEEQAATSQDLTAPVPFVAPEIPKESKRSSFNSILHGKSYNRNSNMAAANNTDLLLTYPNLFANRKFFYIEPTNKLGILSLGSFFTAFDMSNQLGRLTLGYAAPGFGFYIRAGLGRDRISNNGEGTVTVRQENNTTATVAPGVRSTTYSGDDWAFAISKGFLGMNVALNGDWLTKKNQVHVDPDNGRETENKYDSLTVNLSLTNAPTAKNFTWTLGARLSNSRDETLINGDIDDASRNSFIDIAPYIRGGLSVLENENARVLFGTAAIFSYRNFYDPIEVNTLTAILQPSILGEVFVGEKKNFMFYGEIGYDWIVFQYLSNSAVDFSVMTDRMNELNASVGFRYQYKDFLAVEMGIGQQVFSSTKSIFNGDNTFVDFSAMIRF